MRHYFLLAFICLMGLMPFNTHSEQIPEKPPSFDKLCSGEETLLFILLGMTDEYFGKANTLDEERFNLKEEAQADALYKLLTDRLVSVAKLSGRKEVARRLNSLYLEKFIGYDGIERLTTTFDVFKDRSPNDYYAFIAGVYARYWYRDHINFANSTSKAEALCTVLLSVDCEDVVLKRRYVIPIANEVHFKPSPPVTNLFKEIDGILKRERTEPVRPANPPKAGG